MPLPPSPGLHYGTEEDLSGDEELVLLEISRPTIERGQVAAILTRLLALTDTREHILAYQGRVSFMISGFDDDPRELPEVPSVRRFVAQLSIEWPHWLWFLLRNSGAVPLWMALLCDIEIIRNPDNPGEYGTDFCSPHELRGRVRSMLERSERLLKGHKLDPEAIRESRESALRELHLLD